MIRVLFRSGARATRLARGAWRSRWGLVRLCVAAGLLAVLVRDNPARLARLRYAATPDLDCLSEASALLDQQRFGEALLMVDAGLAAADDAQARELEQLRDQIARQRDSLLRRFKAVGVGALVGAGDSVEALLGAITADFFVVGDVRDLAIQSARYVVDGETDELIVALSAAGLITTVAPAADWAPAVLKAARKAGALRHPLAAGLLSLARQAARSGDFSALRRLLADVGELARRGSPAGAVRALRACENASDLQLLADFLRRRPSGALALRVCGADALSLLRRHGAAADEALLLAARKGPAGVVWLRSGAWRVLRPHPLLGLAKAFSKGHASALVARAAAALDPRGWLILPACAGWALLELLLILRRMGRAGREAPPGPRVTLQRAA